MSLAATTRAFSSRPSSQTAKLVLIRLADFADEDNRAAVDWPDLATFAMCSEDEAGFAVACLERDGFLVTEEGLVVRLVGGVQ